MTYPIEQIAEIIGAVRHGYCPSSVAWLLTDSRSLTFPKETVFFALNGKHNDGHDYIRGLYDKGVRNFVVSRLPDRMEDYEGANYLLVDDTLKALQRLAAVHRQKFTVPVIGITGSNGKTIVKEWLYQLLEDNYRITRSPRSYNSQTGVPLSVWMMDESTELGLFEAGISEPGEMRPLWKMIRPTIGILTNIGGAHQENFTSLHEKCLEKLKLFQDCDVVIYDGDNELIQDCVNRSVLSVREIAWSRENGEKPLYISEIDKQKERTVVRYRYIGLDNEYSIPFIDDASVQNSLHCLAVCLYLGMSPEKISQRMWQLEPIGMRLEVKEGLRGCVIINDSYNSDLSSLDIALDFMARRQDDKNRSRTLILSDILQTGMSAKALYRKVDQLIASRGIDKLIGIGREISTVGSLFNVHDKQFFSTTDELLESDALEKMHSEQILVKGARRFRFDRITEQLELKVHETILEVDLRAIAANLNYYRNHLEQGTRIVCMVKASAYGSGAIEVARTLQDNHVNYLAVAVADEGAELRRAGITTGIMVMNPERSAFKMIFENHLEPEIYSFDLLEAFIRKAEHYGITDYPIHIKIDTGMHRLGFAPEDMPELIKRLKRHSAVIPRSVFSHFVGSDSPAFDDFTRLQIQRFESATTQLQEAFSHHIIRHICNTAGIIRFPEVHFDMVRLGLGLYGIDPITNNALTPVCTLKTTILQIRNLQPGETVGYSRRGVIARPSRIAAIPIGYADGLNRHLGNGHAYCLVNGQKAYYVGNICMDVCMIDVTDIDCKEGDSVEIFGSKLPVSELSDVLETIPYEIISTISTRVKRVYFSE